MMPWLRLYGDVLNDRKLSRVARTLDIPYLHALGYWAAILCLANDSPERGSLLYSVTEPLRYSDVAETFRVTVEETERIINAFLNAELLVLVEPEGDGEAGPYWQVVGWSKRQRESDSSAARVRKHRKQKQNVTLPKRDGNAPEEDKEEDKEGEGEGSARDTSSSDDTGDTPQDAGTRPPSSHLSVKVNSHEFIKAYLKKLCPGECIPATQHKSVFKKLQELEQHPLYPNPDNS